MFLLWIVLLAFALAEAFWAATKLVFWFGWLVLTALLHLISWCWHRLEDDPADHPEWWAAKFAEHPEGGWLA